MLPGVSTTVNSAPSPTHWPTANLVSLVQLSPPGHTGNVQVLHSGFSPISTLARLDFPVPVAPKMTRWGSTKSSALAIWKRKMVVEIKKQIVPFIMYRFWLILISKIVRSEITDKWYSLRRLISKKKGWLRQLKSTVGDMVIKMKIQFYKILPLS